jgi:hypothetical protein
MDDGVHTTAGYTALRFRNARLNPEHPPLLKLLAALPLLPLPLHFPLTHPARQEAIDEPWKVAYDGEIAGVFLYEAGNDPHQIAAWARLAPIGMTVGLGILLFLWTQQFVGATAALLTLACYTLLIVAGMPLLLIALGREPRPLDPTVPGTDLFARVRSKVHR